MLNLAARRASRIARGALAVECEQNNRSGDENNEVAPCTNAQVAANEKGGAHGSARVRNTLADPESACI